MAKKNDKSIEDAIKNLDKKRKEDMRPQGTQIPKETEIGFHQGALNTLINERNELIKMIGNVEAVMRAHMKRLEEMGIKIKTEKSKR